jgi:hypothetical protein
LLLLLVVVGGRAGVGAVGRLRGQVREKQQGAQGETQVASHLALLLLLLLLLLCQSCQQVVLA